MRKRFTIITIVAVVALFLVLGSQVLAAPTATTITFPDGLNATLIQQGKTELTAVVPTSVTDGNITVNTDTGTSNPAPFTVGDWFTPDPADAASTAAITASGTLTENTIWDQDILLTGDVVVPAGITLTIEPGVTVLFAALNDDQAGGYFSDSVELHAHGTLTAVGSPDAPIYFTSNAATPAPQDWGGIFIFKENPNAHLSYCSVEYSNFGISFYNKSSGAGLSSGTVEHCTVQNSRFGIYVFNRSGSGTLTTDVTIAHNQTKYNEYGIRVLVHMGAGSGIDTSTIYNNDVSENDFGLLLLGHHWSNGRTTLQTEVRNNFLHDNSQYNLNLHMQDGKATMEPVIENNLFNNTTVMTNTNLLMDGISDHGGTNRIFSPTIRYNTFANAAYGITLLTNVDDIAMNPSIDHNIFYGLSEFAINNTTAESISAEQNYWGNNEAMWDAGASGMVTGTVTATNHLDSSSAPISTYISPGLANVGDEVMLYGANFGVPTVNMPPIARDDDYTTAYETVFIVDAPGVLGNDTDNNGDAITAVFKTNPQHGNLTPNSDGSFTYIPNNGFSGDDTFTYEAYDGQLSSHTATVTITVEEKPEFFIFLPMVVK